MAQSSYRLGGNKYALALNSEWQAEIEEAGSLKQLFEQLNIAIDETLHQRIKGLGGLAKFLDAQADNSAMAIIYDEPAPLAISSKEDLELMLAESVQTKLAMNELFAEWLNQHQHKIQGRFEQWCRSMDIKLDLPEQENAWAYNRLEDTFNGKLKNSLIPRQHLDSKDRLDRDMLMRYTPKQMQEAIDIYCAFCKASGAGTTSAITIANQLIEDIKALAKMQAIEQTRLAFIRCRDEGNNAGTKALLEKAKALGVLKESLLVLAECWFPKKSFECLLANGLQKIASNDFKQIKQAFEQAILSAEKASEEAYKLYRIEQDAKRIAKDQAYKASIPDKMIAMLEEAIAFAQEYDPGMYNEDCFDAIIEAFQLAFRCDRQDLFTLAEFSKLCKIANLDDKSEYAQAVYKELQAQCYQS